MAVDSNAAKIAAWNSDNLPIYEPGLLEIVKKARGRNLFFSTEVGGGHQGVGNNIRFCQYSHQDVRRGSGQGGRPAVLGEDGARPSSKVATTDKIIVEKSTLPVRTAAAMARILNDNDKGVRFEVVSNPEFLAEGTAIERY